MKSWFSCARVLAVAATSVAILGPSALFAGPLKKTKADQYVIKECVVGTGLLFQPGTSGGAYLTEAPNGDIWGAKADSGGIQGATYVGQGRLFRLTRTASK